METTKKTEIELGDVTVELKGEQAERFQKAKETVEKTVQNLKDELDTIEVNYENDRREQD